MECGRSETAVECLVVAGSASRRASSARACSQGSSSWITICPGCLQVADLGVDRSGELRRRRRQGTFVPGLPFRAEETSLRVQVHIRNADAAQLARALARQTGKTISEIVLDALRQYRPRAHALERGNRIELWHRRRDRAHLKRREVPIESFYDEDTGLPE